jgi:hypothetical protein
MILKHIFSESKQRRPREGDTVRIEYMYWVDKSSALDKECCWYVSNDLYLFLLRWCRCFVDCYLRLESNELEAVIGSRSLKMGSHSDSIIEGILKALTNRLSLSRIKRGHSGNGLRWEVYMDNLEVRYLVYQYFPLAVIYTVGSGILILNKIYYLFSDRSSRCRKYTNNTDVITGLPPAALFSTAPMLPCTSLIYILFPGEN